MTVRRVLWVLLGLALILSTGVYVHTLYFFDPITFRQDPITYLPWSWYRRPLEVQAMVRIGPVEHQGVIDDRARVRELVGLLRAGLEPQSPRSDERPGDASVRVNLRCGRRGTNLLLVYGELGSRIWEVQSGSGYYPVTVSSRLQAIVLETAGYR